MSLSLTDIDRLIDKTFNVVFIVIASFVGIVLGAMLFSFALEAILDPLYDYLGDKLGIFFFPVAVIILIIVGTIGHLYGDLLGRFPDFIIGVRKERILPGLAKHLKNIMSLIGIYGLAKLLITVTQNEELQNSAVITKLIFEYILSI